MINLDKHSILITGGTGSFGKAFLKKILKDYPNLRRIVIYSRDELKQWELQQNFPTTKYKNLRYFIGDVRDFSRLKQALEGIDIVIHAAALKQVPAAEYNPIEYIKTNVLGAENLIKACIDRDVKKVIALSTDKAASPINLYGATKLCSDKLFVAANNIIGFRKLSFSVVRYGNVMGSRGSVIPFFLKKAKTGHLPITDEKMTRFNISLEESIEMVLWAIKNSIGKEIFVPKIPSYNIMDIAKAIGPSCKIDIIGIRPGEKLHEEMITSSDSFSTIDLGSYYSILPMDKETHQLYIKENISFKECPKYFSYNSKENTDYLSIEELRLLIKNNIDSEFNPI